MTTTISSFNLVCFCVLMDHHKAGVEAASPDYLQEKFDVMSRCSDMNAFSMLDYTNQRRVADWCLQWNVESPVIRSFAH